MGRENQEHRPSGRPSGREGLAWGAAAQMSVADADAELAVGELLHPVSGYRARPSKLSNGDGLTFCPGLVTVSMAYGLEALARIRHDISQDKVRSHQKLEMMTEDVMATLGGIPIRHA